MTYTCGCPEYEQRIAALEAENAALKAERDEAKQSARRSAVEILAFMGALAECQRDDEVPHETALRIVAERNNAFNNLGEEISLRLELESDLAAARQSRARLVALVKAMRLEIERYRSRLDTAHLRYGEQLDASHRSAEAMERR